MYPKRNGFLACFRPPVPPVLVVDCIYNTIIIYITIAIMVQHVRDRNDNEDRSHRRVKELRCPYQSARLQYRADLADLCVKIGNVISGGMGTGP
jgi:hypothetical protein